MTFSPLKAWITSPDRWWTWRCRTSLVAAAWSFIDKHIWEAKILRHLSTFLIWVTAISTTRWLELKNLPPPLHIPTRYLYQNRVTLNQLWNEHFVFKFKLKIIWIMFSSLKLKTLNQVIVNDWDAIQICFPKLIQVTSLEVSGTCCWVLFSDPHYRGHSQQYRIGQYKSAADIGQLFRDVSSVKNIGNC